MKACVESFLKGLKEKKEISAILLLGGMGKQRKIHPLDKYSDVDISIVVENGIVPDWLPNFSFVLWGEEGITDVLVNVYQCVMASLTDDRIIWDMGKCEAYSSAEVYFDRNGNINDLIHEKIIRSDRRKEKLIGNIHKIDRFIHRNPSKMVFRGQLKAAHLILNEAVRLFFESLYLINGKFVPHLKWQENDLQYLEWLPSECNEKLEEIMTIHEFSEEDIFRRAKAFDQLYTELKVRFEEQDSEDIYKFVCSEINKDRQLLKETAADCFLSECNGEDKKKYYSYINSRLLGKKDLDSIRTIRL